MKCLKCFVEKDESEFQLRKDTKKLRSECRDCANKRIYEWTKNNKFLRKKHIEKQREKLLCECSICNTKFIKNSVVSQCSLRCRLKAGSKIEEQTGCWIWQGPRSGNYGKIRVNQMTISTHRISYLEFNGPITDGLQVCHKCDNPLCINPEHLWLGTAKENMQDAKEKDRVDISGMKNRFCKLTDGQIAEIRNLKNQGFTYNRLSTIFNCTVTHLYRIIKKKSRI